MQLRELLASGVRNVTKAAIDCKNVEREIIAA